MAKTINETFIVVTGGAGFIGSRLVAALNARGYTNILVVDDLTDGQKIHNLARLTIHDYWDKADFLEAIRDDSFPYAVEVCFHLGACSATTEWDGRFLMTNNYDYSKALLTYCTLCTIPFIYASSAAVYGMGGAGFREEEACETPINAYAYSKWLFDGWVRRVLDKAAHDKFQAAPIAGVRYFNVYGPNEAHKGAMASVAYHLYNQVKAGKPMRLFGAYDGYEAGGQMRDFVYVDDAVAFTLWLWERKTSGIFNCGTGCAEPFQAIADALTAHYPKAKLEYIDFPEHLKGAYQSYTQADIGAARRVGYEGAFRPVAKGVAAYIAELEKGNTA